MNDKTLRLIEDKFVPAIVAPNHRGLYLPSDAAIFKKYFKAPGPHPSAIKEGASLPRRGSLFVFAASGQPIEVTNDGSINEQLNAVLQAFAKLPQQQRAPAEAKAKLDLSLLKHKVEPPAGGLTLRMYSRYLVPDGQGRYRPATYRTSNKNGNQMWEWMPGYKTLKKDQYGSSILEAPKTDNFWVTQAEWRSLLPPDAKPGDKVAVPETLYRRLYLYGLHIYGSSESCVTWVCNASKPLEYLKYGELSGRVERANPKKIVLRLTGNFRLDRPQPFIGGEQAGRFYRGQLAGTISYDRIKKTVTRFDLAVLGSYRGYWESLDAGNAANTETLVGFAFELAQGAAIIDTAPLGAVNEERDRYLAGGK